MFVRALLLLLFFGLSACSGADSEPALGGDDAGGSQSTDADEKPDTNVSETDAGRTEWPLDSPGVEVLTTSFDGLDREVRLAIPAGEITGLVILLHGSGQTAESFLEKRRRFIALAHEQNWLVVAPLAEAVDGKTRWNFDGNPEEPRDDLFILSIVDQLEAQGVQGPRYLASFSNGGRMTHTLMGQHPDRFAAAGIVASNLGTYDILGTDEDRLVLDATGPANIWMANGSQDPSVPFEGGVGESGTAPSVQEAIDRWTAASGCSGDGTRRDFAGGYELVWTNCTDDFEVVQVAYRSSRHAWPEPGDVPEFDANTELLDFFLRHP